MAQRIRHEDGQRQIEITMAWLHAASRLRSAVLKAERTVKERYRVSGREAAGGKYIRELAVEAALTAVAYAHGKVKADDLEQLLPDALATAIANVKFAVDEALAAANEIARLGEDYQAIQLVSTWTAAMSAWHSHFGVRARGDLAVAILGTGKTHAPMHVAALVLAELGHSTADIHRALQSARPGDIRDRAQVRRLIRPARSS